MNDHLNYHQHFERLQADAQLLLRPEEQTDLANSRRFVAMHRDRLRYCHPWAKWLVWDGCRWKVDDDGASIRLAKDIADAIWKTARVMDDAKLTKFAGQTAGRQRIDAMLALAQSDLSILPADLDANAWLLNCLNGTVDLRTGRLREHRRDDCITKICPVDFDPAAECLRWVEFLGCIFGNAANLIRFVQKFLGYRLTGDIREQLLLIFWGVGCNGKSTLLDIVTWLMGDYAGEAPPNLLTERRGSDEHPCEIADLCGRRLVVASENEKGRRMRIGLMKMITGNARLKARFNRKDYFKFDRTFEPLLVTNNKPRIRENTKAVWRRIRLVPFNIVIPDAEIDPVLPDKL
jgi:putative DNA primase/helicase